MNEKTIGETIATTIGEMIADVRAAVKAAEANSINRAGEHLRYPPAFGDIHTTTDASEAFIVGVKLCEALRFLFINNLTEWGIVAI